MRGYKAKEVLKEKERKKDVSLKLRYIFYNKHGLENVAVEDITLKANVGKGTFYSFFKTKGDVLVHYLNSAVNRSIEEFELKVLPLDTLFKSNRTACFLFHEACFFK